MKNKKAKYLDPNKPVTERVNDLISQMTLEEKFGQMVGCLFYEFMKAGNSDRIEDMTFSSEKANKLIKNGIGHISFLPYFANRTPKALSELTNEIQKYLINNTRLSIPAIIHGECIGGFAARGAIHYPMSLGLSSTWEPDLIEKMADQIRKQMRSVGIQQGYGPVLDITRDPRWGRVEETYGEDIYLCSRIGVSFIKGLQGKDLSNGVIATAKHFIGGGVSEGGMNTASAKISLRELLEHFVIPFEAAIAEANLVSVMSAYNDVDGIPVTSSYEMLTELLRSKLGFKGYVVADYYAIIGLKTFHHIAETVLEAGRLALNAGVDIELPTTECWNSKFLEEVRNGLISMDLIDQAVSRQLYLKFKLGLFDNPFVDVNSVSGSFKTNEQKEHAYHLAKKSIILLKNENQILPLKKDLISMAVIGPNANNFRHQVGTYSYPNFQESLRELKHSEGKTDIPLPAVTGGDIYFSGATVLECIRQKVAQGTKILYAEGCKVMGNSTNGFIEAIEKVKNADLAIVVAGGNSGVLSGYTSGECNDSSSIYLPGVQGKLVKEIAKTKTPIVLILINGRPFGIADLIDLSSAVIEAWLPGEMGGMAIADVLFGDYNPGGKLPITIPRSSGQIPVYYNHRTGSGTSLHRGYVDLPASPLFNFGYGLSYTEFKFSNLRINKSRIKSFEEVEISLDIKNIGKFKGEEVVQLYISDLIASVSRPIKELKGFKRISLKPGEKKTIIFIISATQLAFYNRDMKLVVEPGDFNVMIGNSSQDNKLSGEFKIMGELTEVKGKRIFFSKVKLK